MADRWVAWIQFRPFSRRGVFLILLLMEFGILVGSYALIFSLRVWIWTVPEETSLGELPAWFRGGFSSYLVVNSCFRITSPGSSLVGLRLYV